MGTRITDDDDDDNETTSDEQLTRNAAARYLGVSSRTISRAVQRADLQRLVNGKFSKAELDRFKGSMQLEEELDGPSEDPAEKVIKGLTDSLATITGFAERQLKLIEAPMHVALETVQKINEQTMKMLEMAQSTMLEHQTQLGEILLRKDERAALTEEAKGRREALANMGKVVAPFIPKLLDQMVGGGPAQDFVKSLDSDEKQSLASLAMMFEGEKRTKFEAMLRALQISVPVKEEPQPEPDSISVEETSNVDEE